MKKLTRLIGRQVEQNELASARDSGRPELIAVYGRRRIGKTHLIRSFFSKELCFELTGVRDASAKIQLNTFAKTLQAATGFQHTPPPSWVEAFEQLKTFLEPKLRGKKRVVIFFDELPWLASKRSQFLPAFEHFWNSWATYHTQLIVVICGSAASWMIAKVLNQKGGLHNRITRSIALLPFSLKETEEFLHSRGVSLDRKQILELSMATGGIAYYLDHVKKGLSASQNIDALFFAKNAWLQGEFEKLFAALFEHHERHLKVIRALARKQMGLSRDELLLATQMPSGGNISNILQELEASGFIGRTIPFGRNSRDVLYRLIDEFSLFYLKWVEHKRSQGNAQQWAQRRGTPTWQAWSGYAFENQCLKSVAQIKSALGIAGVETQTSAWRFQSKNKNEEGAQIDLLIDRKDGVINVCEAKFSDAEFVIDKKYAHELRTKQAVFRQRTGTRKALFLTFITTYGVKSNRYSSELVNNNLGIDVLFDS